MLPSDNNCFKVLVFARLESDKSTEFVSNLRHGEGPGLPELVQELCAVKQRGIRSNFRFVLPYKSM